MKFCIRSVILYICTCQWHGGSCYPFTSGDMYGHAIFTNHPHKNAQRHQNVPLHSFWKGFWGRALAHFWPSKERIDGGSSTSFLASATTCQKTCTGSIQLFMIRVCIALSVHACEAVRVRVCVCVCACVNEWVNESVNEWINERTTEGMHEWMNACMHAWMNACMRACMGLFLSLSLSLSRSLPPSLPPVHLRYICRHVEFLKFAMGQETMAVCPGQRKVDSMSTSDLNP